jgi:hypothetical protein
MQEHRAMLASWEPGMLMITSCWCRPTRKHTLNQDYSSRDIKKKPKVIRTRIIVLTTMDAFFAIKTYVNEVVLV